MSQDLTSLLNQQVANWSLLYFKFHNYHWFVKGETFFELHEKFEALYEEAHNNIDVLAERVLMIGGKPVATISENLANTSLQEATGNETPKQMIQQVIADLTQLTKETKKLIESAEQAKDIATVDLMTGVLGKVEKNIWMLQAYAG